MRDSMVFYRNFRDAVSKLPAEQRLEAYEAIFAYALDGESPGDGVVGAVVQMIVPAIDKNNQRYENGKKGGRPKNQTEPNQNQTKPNNNQTEPNRNQVEPKCKVRSDKCEVLSEKEESEKDAFILADGSAFVLPSSRIAEYEKTFPNVNVKAELLRCRLKHNAMRQKRNQLTIEQYIVNWLINAQSDEKKKPSFSDMLQRNEKFDDKFLNDLRGRNGNMI